MIDHALATMVIAIGAVALFLILFMEWSFSLRQQIQLQMAKKRLEVKHLQQLVDREELRLSNERHRHQKISQQDTRQQELALVKEEHHRQMVSQLREAQSLVYQARKKSKDVQAVLDRQRKYNAQLLSLQHDRDEEVLECLEKVNIFFHVKAEEATEDLLLEY